MSTTPGSARGERGARAYARGSRAEDLACAALVRDGWTVRARRVRTPAGEVDIVAEKHGLLAFVEVKARPTLNLAAHALSIAQSARLLAAGEFLLGENPRWGACGVRFDVVLVDARGTVRRVPDALRVEG